MQYYLSNKVVYNIYNCRVAYAWVSLNLLIRRFLSPFQFPYSGFSDIIWGVIVINTDERVLSAYIISALFSAHKRLWRRRGVGEVGITSMVCEVGVSLGNSNCHAKLRLFCLSHSLNNKYMQFIHYITSYIIM